MNRISCLWRSFVKDPWQAGYAVPLLLVNAAGSAYGYYWYSGQLARTARELWLFVPDSPLATTMFAGVLALSLLGYGNAYLNLLALTANIKYGLWAVIVISDFWAGGGSVRFAEAMLWVSHLGMAAQGVIYLRACLFGTPPGPGRGVAGRALAVTAVWMLLNDFLDYCLGIYPYLYEPGQVLLGAVSAVSLSLALVVSIKILSFTRLSKYSR
ncbi:MAG: DUF1405 domain-containing protein [Peptococcaceae bacterium]|nr:DUF1405 domain-containing protein [Peptococcaceae bacterium]